MFLNRRELRNLVANGNEVLIPKPMQLSQYFVRTNAAYDSLPHAAHGLFNLLAHMSLHIDVTGNVDQHRAMLVTLAAKLSGCAGEYESTEGLLQRRRNDLLAVIGRNMDLWVLGRHPARVQVWIVVVQNISRKRQRTLSSLLG
ncbi:hypothetical protein D3C76_1303930 [compost metagenome]